MTPCARAASRHFPAVCSAVLLCSAAFGQSTLDSSRSSLDDPAKASKTWKGLAHPEPADIVITDAKIYTEDPFRRTVEALAIRGGRIVFTGNTTDAAKLIGPKTKVERASGKLILPGLVDAHIHPMGIVDFGGCSLQSKARTLAELATFVSSCVKRMNVPPATGSSFRIGNTEGGIRPITITRRFVPRSMQRPPPTQSN